MTRILIREVKCKMTSSEPQGHLPYGDAGTGHYGTWCSKQSIQNIDIVKDRIFKAVESIPVETGNGGNLFTIGDYGCADPSISFPILRDLIRLVRKKHGEIPVQIVYEDQPSNDFNSVFKRVHGLIPDPPSYLTEFQKVFVMASGTSFYQQVLPDHTAHLIMSFMGTYWTSQLATTFQKSFHRFPDASEEERKLAAAQAAKDWDTFLVLRARELKSGGVLVVSTPAEDPAMQCGGVRVCSQGPEEGMLDIWRQMRDEGKITQEEFVNTNFVAVSRYLEESRAPFEDTDSAVYRSGLRLMKADLVLSPCITRREWREKLDREGIDDRATWAKDLVNHHRCWSNSSFTRGLSDTRSESEKEAVVDELYRRLETQMLRQHPKDFKTDHLQVYVYARKV